MVRVCVCFKKGEAGLCGPEGQKFRLLCNEITLMCCWCSTRVYVVLQMSMSVSAMLMCVHRGRSARTLSAASSACAEMGLLLGCCRARCNVEVRSLFLNEVNGLMFFLEHLNK